MNLVYETCNGIKFIKQIKDNSKDTIMYAIFNCEENGPDICCPELEKDKTAKLDYSYSIYNPLDFNGNEDKNGYDEYETIGSFYITNETIVID